MDTRIEKMTDPARVEALKTEKEAELNKKFAELGKMYYEKNGSSPDYSYSGIVGEIMAISADIKDCDERVLQIKELIVCPRCGAVNKSKYVFCTECGFRMKEEELPEIPAAPVVEEPVAAPAEPELPVAEPTVESTAEPVAEPAVEEVPYAIPLNMMPEYQEERSAPQPLEGICSTCGNVISPGAKFCIYCGTRVPEQPSVQPEPVDNGRVCSRCGEVYSDPTVKFCIKCGNKL